MVARCVAPAVRRLPMNRKGRDFAVGDVHGCIGPVDQALERVDFDPAVDRLICVGDLINRHPESARAAEFYRRAYVFATRGNHEDFVIGIHQDGEPHRAVINYLAENVGFGWWRETPRALQMEILEAARALPIAIEVETEAGPVGIVHADVPFGLAWPDFIAAIERGEEDILKEALWSRDRHAVQDVQPVEGVWRVYTGHTPVDAPSMLGNVCNLDTGAVFGVLGHSETGALTLVDLMADAALIEAERARPRGPDLLRLICPRGPRMATRSEPKSVPKSEPKAEPETAATTSGEATARGGGAFESLRHLAGRPVPSASVARPAGQPDTADGVATEVARDVATAQPSAQEWENSEDAGDGGTPVPRG